MEVFQPFKNLPQDSGDSCLIKYTMPTVTGLDAVLDYVQQWASR